MHDGSHVEKVWALYRRSDNRLMAFANGQGEFELKSDLNGGVKPVNDLHELEDGPVKGYLLRKKIDLKDIDPNASVTCVRFGDYRPTLIAGGQLEVCRIALTD